MVESPYHALDIYQSPLVKLFVGPDETLITAHLKVLERSDFFCRALREQRFQEGIDMKVNMPEEDPRVLSYIVDWLYGGWFSHDIDKLCENFQIYDCSDKSELEEAIRDHIDAYILADKLGIDQLINDIVDAMHNNITKLPIKWAHIQQFIAGGMPDCPLKNLLIRALARKIRTQNWTVNRELEASLKKELTNDVEGAGVELLRIVMLDGADTDITQESSCKWHTHQHGRCPENTDNNNSNY